MTSDGARGNRMPWAFAIGVAVMALGLFALFAGSGDVPGPWIALGVGVLLTCTGLVQKSIEKSRR